MKTGCGYLLEAADGADELAAACQETEALSIFMEVVKLASQMTIAPSTVTVRAARHLGQLLQGMGTDD
jgi:hypothetical protein